MLFGNHPAEFYIEGRTDEILHGDIPCTPEQQNIIANGGRETAEKIKLIRELIENSIQSNKERVKPVSEKVTNTGMTVCVPLAIRHETPETIERFMQQIINASSNVENGVNVLIWANAKYNENENSIDVKQQSEALYEELRQKLLDLENKPESANITISTALEVVPSSEFSMSQIRNNYMEAITGRLIDGEIDETHPIVWLDADTTRIRPNTLSAIQRHIKKDPCKFYHPDINYSLEWLEGKRPEEWDVNSKLLFIDEMAQREHKRVAVEKGLRILDRCYPDEPGLSFSLYGFILAGGLNTKDPINESHWLLKRAGQIGNMKYLDDDRRSQVGIEVSARRTYQEMSSLPPGINEVPYRTFSHESKYTMSSDLSSNSRAELDQEATALYLLDKRRSGIDYTEADEAARKVTKRMLANKVLGLSCLITEK